MSEEVTPTSAPQATATPPAQTNGTGNGLGVAALIIGIVAFLGGLIPFWGLVTGIVAVILGFLALKKAPAGKGLSITGIVLGGIAVITNLVVVIIFLVSIAAIGGSEEFQKAVQEELESSQTTDESNSSEATASEPINLSGTGQTASERFQLNSGLATFTLTHQGTSNFSATLLDKDGGYVGLLANEIGDFNGSKAIRIDSADEYLVDISADGPWTIKIEQ